MCRLRTIQPLHKPASIKRRSNPIGVFICGTLLRMPTNFIFRPVRLGDKPRILEFTAHTWGEDEDDYIQYVFDDWLNDPRGEFTAVESNGQCVAIAKLTDTGSDEWWFEGLRVDPDARGQGIGAALNRYQVDLARKLGGRVIRYMTDGDNVGSQTIGFKTGFQHVLTYQLHVAEPIAASSLMARLTVDDLSALKEWLDSPLVRYAHGLYRAGWKVRAFTESVLRDTLAACEAYGLKDRSGRITAWCVLRPQDDEETKRIRIDHIDGEVDSIAQLANSIRVLAHQCGREGVRVGVLNYDPLLKAVSTAGYLAEKDSAGMWVLEKKLDSAIVG
jgi:GNAT superfamily N-acetyltransferase